MNRQTAVHPRAAGAHTANDARRDYRPGEQTQSKPQVRADDANLASEKVEIRTDRGTKKIFLDLRENGRGRLVRVVEDNSGRRSNIVIPAERAREVAELLLRLADYHDRLPKL